MDKPKRRIYSSVDEIFETDDLGIFQDIQKKKPVTSDSGLKQSKFDEINNFLDSNKRKPNFESNEVSERSLARRLQAYREDLELGLCVADYDRYGLLDGFTRPLEVDVTQLAQEAQVSDSEANQSSEKEQYPEVVTLSEIIQFELALTLFTQQIEDLESREDKRSIEFAQSLNQFFQGWVSFFDNDWQSYYDRFLDLFNEMQDISIRMDALTKKAFSEAFSGDADNVEQDYESEQEDLDSYKEDDDDAVLGELDEDFLSLLEQGYEPVSDLDAEFDIELDTDLDTKSDIWLDDVEFDFEPPSEFDIEAEGELIAPKETSITRRYNVGYSRVAAWATRNSRKKSYHNDLVVDQLNDRAFATGFSYIDFNSGLRFKQLKKEQADELARAIDTEKTNVEDNSQVAAVVKNKPVTDGASRNLDRQQPRKEQVNKNQGLFDEFRFDDSNERGDESGVSAAKAESKPILKTRKEIGEVEVTKPLVLEDIFDDDELGIFDDIDSELFDVPLELQDPRTRLVGEDDLIGERKPCLDFDDYKATFSIISKHMADGNYHRHDVIREKSIHIGSVFVINNMDAYVADKYLAEDREDKNRRNERLRLIFSNGTESNMLAFSLTLAPYKYDNSYQVEITDEEWVNAHFNKGFMSDTETKLKEPDGYIYIARLKDKPDELYHYKDLHKIGLTRKSGEGRTKDSINDATFLHREVEIVGEWAIRNADIYKVEQYIHRFLKEAKVTMKVATNKDRLQGANEWFDVPYHEIDKVVQLVVSGDIADYKYDPYRKKVVFK